MDAIQQNLETEARLKMEAVVVRKKLEQDITELEITLESVNKARADAEKNWKQCQQEVDDLETLLEEEQKAKSDQLFLYVFTCTRVGLLLVSSLSVILLYCYCLWAMLPDSKRTNERTNWAQAFIFFSARRHASAVYVCNGCVPVCVSICLSVCVCLSLTFVNPAKTAEPI